MPRSVSPSPIPTALPLLLALLAAPIASARPLADVAGSPWMAHPRSLSLRMAPLPDDAGGELVALRVEPEPTRDVPRGSRTVTPPAEVVAGDAPVSPGTWMAYGSIALIPLGGIYGASRLGGERTWVTAAQTLGGSALGMVPASLLFLQPAEAGGRWAELDVAAFGAGLVLTPPLAALGTWGMGELAFDGSRHRGRAFLGALGGAAAGTLLGVAMHGVLEEVVGNRPALKPLRKYIALGFIGSGATAGYQWAGGGPRPRAR